MGKHEKSNIMYNLMLEFYSKFNHIKPSFSENILGGNSYTRDTENIYFESIRWKRNSRSNR